VIWARIARLRTLYDGCVSAAAAHGILRLRFVFARLQPCFMSFKSAPETSAKPSTAMSHNRRDFLTALVLSALGGGNTCASEKPVGKGVLNADGILERLRAANGFPALAGAVANGSEILAAGASGLRCMGRGELVKVEDRFHFGSLTKSMTATLAARIVEQKKIRWDSTVGEALHGWSGDIHQTYREVTLEQLLWHRGGAPADAPKEIWREAWRKTGTARAQRERFVRSLLKMGAPTPPNTQFVYSNQGYAIAGAMLEEVSDLGWESLLEKEVFQKVGMKTAGFGVPGPLGEAQEPWGHVQEGAGYKPIQLDNPPAIGPAATVHGSVLDFVRYGSLHLNGARGVSTDYLEPAAWKKLHTPAPGQIYAMGWASQEDAWTGGPSLWHNGSNTFFYAILWISPATNLTVGVVANADTKDVRQACEKAAAALAGMV